MILVLLPFGAHCPKCGLTWYSAVRHCKSCDDSPDHEHLHKTCACGFARVEECIDPAKADEHCNHKPMGLFARLKLALRITFRGH